ncbi:MAG: TIGR03086 family protein [Actinomycetia bacterium]|nr:TIGR03086 family protein [Actinomycetes bacterium]
MSTAPLEQAIATAKKVLAGVTPEHLGATTPCASWKVSDLVNHIIGAQHFFGSLAQGAAPSDAAAPDFSAGDFNASFAQSAADAVAAFKVPGTMEKTLQLPWGPMPGAAFAGLAATDTFTHAWDLARATGQNTDLDPELAAGLLMGARAGIAPEFRGADGVAPFGPEQKAPAGASKADELAAFLGRTI